MFSKLYVTTVLLIVSCKAVYSFVIFPAASFSTSATCKRSNTLSPLGPMASNGLNFEDIKVGEGKEVESGDSISIHYSGSFVNSNEETVEFENSRTAKVNKGVIGATEGMPIIFPIGKNKVIEGWEKGILGMANEITPMKEGGKRKLTIPADLAYGAEGRGEIPGNQELTFEVELISINIKTTSFLNQFFRFGVPGVFGFLILNSIYLILTGQA